MELKYKKGQKILDRYGRRYKIVEARIRVGATGKEYGAYNLYPLNVNPVPAYQDYVKANGWEYEPYLDTTENVLDINVVKVY